MPPALNYKCTHTLGKSSKIENFLTQHDSMPPALTNAHILEKSSQMKNFLTQYTYDSMPHKCTHTRKILTNGKFPHPV